MAFQVLLPSHAIEQFLDVFGAHAGCTRCLAICQLAGHLPQFAIHWNIVIDLNQGDIDWEGVTR